MQVRPHSLRTRLVATTLLLLAVASALIAAVTTLTLHRFLVGRLDDDLRISSRAVAGLLRRGTPTSHGRRRRRAPAPATPSPRPSVTAASSSASAFTREGGIRAVPTLGVPGPDRVLPRRPARQRRPRRARHLPPRRRDPAGRRRARHGPARGTAPGDGRAASHHRARRRAARPDLGARLRRRLRWCGASCGRWNGSPPPPDGCARCRWTGARWRSPSGWPDTDLRTEVGQVGAALNRMLDHVGCALEARHASETQVRQFVADASHELRTPLAAIRGYAELTRRGQPSPRRSRTCSAGSSREAQRMTTLVEDLLLLARLDAGRPLARRTVDLTRLVVDAVSDATPPARITAGGSTCPTSRSRSPGTPPDCTRCCEPAGERPNPHPAGTTVTVGSTSTVPRRW